MSEKGNSVIESQLPCMLLRMVRLDRSPERAWPIHRMIPIESSICVTRSNFPFPVVCDITFFRNLGKLESPQIGAFTGMVICLRPAHPIENLSSSLLILGGLFRFLGVTRGVDGLSIGRALTSS